MRSKKETIKLAWGGLYDRYKSNISLIDGYIHIDPLFHKYEDFLTSDFIRKEFKGFYYFRPKTLEGIEDNNGWIQIEDCPTELPTETVWLTDGDKIWEGEIFDDLFKSIIVTNATHYQLKTRPEKLIYNDSKK